MKQIGKLLALGAAVMFLLQSCVTVRSHRHRHHHRHCIIVEQPITDTPLYNLPSTEYVATSEISVYGKEG